MDPQLVQTLLTQGGNVGSLLVAVWVLSRTLKNQYEARISVLESHVNLCDQDRAKLHQQIYELQQSQIDFLKSHSA